MYRTMTLSHHRQRDLNIIAGLFQEYTRRKLPIKSSSKTALQEKYGIILYPRFTDRERSNSKCLKMERAGNRIKITKDVTDPRLGVNQPSALTFQVTSCKIVFLGVF